jgi:hypothetical protein
MLKEANFFKNIVSIPFLLPRLAIVSADYENSKEFFPLSPACKFPTSAIFRFYPDNSPAGYRPTKWLAA